MKKLVTLFAIALSTMSTAHAKSAIGQCVGPETTVAKNGYLELKKPVFIFSAPDEASSKVEFKKANASFTVNKEVKGFIQLTEVEGWSDANPNAGKVLGWAKRTDFRFLALRNCN
ncbi:hypothetical protein [Herbaspirillum hiltneri]|uniref:hypothetical protein n=1 Tax=Herbaspirillum hiltneri TaxID=341045 RepID=UPI000AEED404|nr:hypothetical protein [Herbaspirillum hiltneri]